ncbi:MAG: hypothetical protein R3C03_13650 [Pirellulaceae bacterium]
MTFQIRINMRTIMVCVTMICLMVVGCNVAVTNTAPVADQTKVHVWGRRGLDPGQFNKPRAIAVSPDDELFIVDKLGRIQVFDCEGNYLREWRTPLIDQGKPCGLTFHSSGLLMVADTHYFRILFYTVNGELVDPKTIGGINGRRNGEFGFVTDVVEDANGDFFVSDYGDYDRIQKFDANGEFVSGWGGHGSDDMQFLRPQSLAIDQRNRLWVADSCNHRIQIFDVSTDTPKLVKSIGAQGNEPGQLKYPYSIWLNDDETFYVCELGNHRVQKMTFEGKSLGCFGGPGKGVGEFDQPWAIVIDSQGTMHMLDTYNHRVQSFRFEEVASFPE